MGKKIGIIDIGNTHIHSLAFVQTGEQMPKIYTSPNAKTPRDKPLNLKEKVRQEIYKMADAHPDIKGILINSFSGAFIYADQYHFADKDVPKYTSPTEGYHEITYYYTGQNNKYELVGLPALLMAVDDFDDQPPLSPHQWVCERIAESKIINTNMWDITHASRTGIFNLWHYRWCQLDKTLHENRAARQLVSCPIGPAITRIGTIRGIPLFAGGLDHSFISAYHSKAYVASGTWTNIVQAEPVYAPLRFEHTHIRWGILADNQYAKEIVFPSHQSDNLPALWQEDMNFRTSVALIGATSYRIQPHFTKTRLSYGMEIRKDLEQEAAAYCLARHLSNLGEITC